MCVRVFASAKDAPIETQKQWKTECTCKFCWRTSSQKRWARTNGKVCAECRNNLRDKTKGMTKEEAKTYIEKCEAETQSEAGHEAYVKEDLSAFRKSQQDCCLSFTYIMQTHHIDCRVATVCKYILVRTGVHANKSSRSLSTSFRAR